MAGELAAGSDALFLLVLGAYWRRDLGKVSIDLPREICWAPGLPVGRRKRTKADGPAEVGGPCSTGRRGNARRARGVERSGAREDGPGRRSGVAARTAGRDSRRPARVRSRDGLEPVGDRSRGGCRRRSSMQRRPRP
jgi:hypothetical protein